MGGQEDRGTEDARLAALESEGMFVGLISTNMSRLTALGKRTS
jgi:hypothetical protein